MQRALSAPRERFTTLFATMMWRRRWCPVTAKAAFVRMYG